jgi:hypothetical protein
LNGEAGRLLAAAACSAALAPRLDARRKTIEASIAAEVLAGNKYKEDCERTALAEIQTLEIWLSNGCR